MAQILAFVSGKGGTGKTSMCAAIACCLAASGKKVLCIDLDVGLRNLDIALGMTELAVLPFTALLGDEYSLEDAAEHPKIPGLFLLTAPVSSAPEDVDESAFRVLLSQAEEHFDFILLDAPAGVGCLFRLAASCAHRAVVVTGSDRATLRDGTRAAGLLGDTPASLLVNRLNPKLFKKMRATVDDIMDEVSLPLIGLVPEDETVALSAMAGDALVLRSRKGAAKACLRIARRLQGIKEPLPMSR